jgi:hypothetical protein
MPFTGTPLDPGDLGIDNRSNVVFGLTVAAACYCLLGLTTAAVCAAAGRFASHRVQPSS